MKTLLASSLVICSLLAASPSLFAIDDVLHDIADHTIGHGHHRDYYTYNSGYGGYQNYSGYYAHPHYSHTHYRSGWTGGHRHHHSAGLGAFGIDHGHGHGHGH